jgi:site-specific recombinase XerD
VQSSNPISIAEYYRVRLAKIDKKFHPHRFRDTFASNLLLKGVSIENVAILLGNTVRVCEKHYAPWIKAARPL